jgi:hypothetical protein
MRAIAAWVSLSSSIWPRDAPIHSQREMASKFEC